MPTLRYSIIATALLLCSVTVHAVNPAPAIDQGPSQATVAKIHRFLERFIDPNKTPAEQAAMFADHAEYYDQGVVGKKRIAWDVKNYSRLWPQRDYELLRVDSIIPDPATDRALVRYQISFEVAKPDRKIAGTAYYIALIGDLNSTPKIEQIEEIILRQRVVSAEARAVEASDSSGSDH